MIATKLGFTSKSIVASAPNPSPQYCAKRQQVDVAIADRAQRNKIHTRLQRVAVCAEELVPL
jgi:hypothetical protein